MRFGSPAAGLPKCTSNAPGIERRETVELNSHKAFTQPIAALCRHVCYGSFQHQVKAHNLGATTLDVVVTEQAPTNVQRHRVKAPIRKANTVAVVPAEQIATTVGRHPVNAPPLRADRLVVVHPDQTATKVRRPLLLTALLGSARRSYTLGEVRYSHGNDDYIGN